MAQSVAVIGAGIIGLCTALELTKRGIAVTLFDGKGVAMGCSFGNAGHFATEQVFPLAEPSLLTKLPRMLFDKTGPLRLDWRYLGKALPWFWRFLLNMQKRHFVVHSQALRALNEAALPAYQRLLGESYATLINANGSLLTFEHQDFALVDKLAAQFRAQGVAVKVLRGQEIQALEPELGRNVQQALWFTEVAHSSDPHTLCLTIKAQLDSAQVQFNQAHIKHIYSSSQGVIVTTVDDEQHRFDELVIAAGAWSKPLVKQLGFNVPLDTERGYHAMLNCANPITRPVASADRQFIITPMAMGLRLAGTVEFAGLNAPENHQRAQVLLPHAQALIPTLAGDTISSTWMGCRPSLPDSLPVIGTSPKHSNIHFAFGHQHLGLTQGAITAELVADCIQRRSPRITLHPYRIDRF
ncbi:NAD(P)/FAD-dependent oxidoreductase [Pseudoalteromonas fenneropenaei]|uniref:NAD(P)/FAD-dependent oxidoreductase n=1 Tax=Pseudoalteromonas fenneropenaei TaxID=1737459 RepID=A0ABV7CFP3_9GAMM